MEDLIVTWRILWKRKRWEGQACFKQSNNNINSVCSSKVYILTKKGGYCHHDLLTSAPDPKHWHSQLIKYLENAQAELNRWVETPFYKSMSMNTVPEIPLSIVNDLSPVIDVLIINALISIFLNMPTAPFPWYFHIQSLDFCGVLDFINFAQGLQNFLEFL